MNYTSEEPIKIYRYWVYGVQQRNEIKIGKIKKHTKFYETTVSHPKKHKLFNKSNQHNRIRFFPQLSISPKTTAFNWTCQYCDNLTRKQNDLANYKIMIKNNSKNENAGENKSKNEKINKYIYIYIYIYLPGS